MADRSLQDDIFGNGDTIINTTLPDVISNSTNSTTNTTTTIDDDQTNSTNTTTTDDEGAVTAAPAPASALPSVTLSASPSAELSSAPTVTPTTIDENILSCPLVGFLPFTTVGKEWPYYGLGNSEFTSWPYTHMAAALMAVDHFNDKNPAVVPTIAEMTQNCTVVLEPPVFANTDFNVAEVAKFLVNEAYDDVRFCGIVGPFANDPALEAANLASGLDIPMITHNADDTRLTGRFVNPHVASVNVNLNAQSEAIVHWFRKNGRTDFLATIAVTATYGDQFQGTMDSAAKEAGFQHTSFYTIAPPWRGFEPNRGIGIALQTIKELDGYRNIFIALNEPEEQLQIVADHAEEFEMNSGEHVWVVSGNMDQGQLSFYASQNENVTKLVRGMALVRSMDGFESSMASYDQSDPFLESWKSQDFAFVERVNALHPIKRTNAKGYFQAEPTYFQTELPVHGAGFMYDAVMAQGLGRCEQQFMESGDDNNGNGGGGGGNAGTGGGGNAGGGGGGGNAGGGGNTNRGRRRRVKGEASKQGRRRAKKQIDTNPHLEGIFSTAFEGATGEVIFGEGFRNPGNRKRESITYGAYNFRASGPDELAMNPDYTTWSYLTDVLKDGPVSGTWRTTAHALFIFASGLATPPTRNHDWPQQNYLSNGVQMTGLSFFALSMALAIASTIFIFVNRRKPVVRQSQAEFLYILMLGCATMSAAIFAFSFDEEDGWNDQMLDRACLASPWLIALGYISIYCALFSKLWRINRVLQFARRKVEVRHVVGPFALIVLCTVGVLVAWTVLDPFVWERRIIDAQSLETYGRCSSEHSLFYVIALVVLMAVSTVACGFMAWKTKDVDSRFSESKWIFYTIFVQIQVLLLGIPVLVILDNASADATYFGRVLVIFLLVVTTIMLMIGPKVAATILHDAETQRNSDASSAINRRSSTLSGRGNIASGGTRVSGIHAGTQHSSYRTREDLSNSHGHALSISGDNGSRYNRSFDALSLGEPPSLEESGRLGDSRRPSVQSNASSLPRRSVVFETGAIATSELMDDEIIDDVEMPLKS